MLVRKTCILFLFAALLGAGSLRAQQLSVEARIAGLESNEEYMSLLREDAQLLYGFSTKAERELFRLLISVSGVGGNTARMILSTYSPRELQGIITAGNAVLLKNVKGLGLKTAQKIIVELSGKMAGLGLTGDTVTAPVAGGDYEEALAALVMLGFGKAAADKVVKIVARENPGASVEDLVRMSLKRL